MGKDCLLDHDMHFESSESHHPLPQRNPDKLATSIFIMWDVACSWYLMNNEDVAVSLNECIASHANTLPMRRRPKHMSVIVTTRVIVLRPTLGVCHKRCFN